MSEEKSVLYTRKHPASNGVFDNQAQAMQRRDMRPLPAAPIVKAICGSSSKSSLA